MKSRRMKKKLTHWNLFLHHVLYYCKNKIIQNRSWSIPFITLFILSYLFHLSKDNSEKESQVKKENEEIEIDSIFSK